MCNVLADAFHKVPARADSFLCRSWMWSDIYWRIRLCHSSIILTSNTPGKWIFSHVQMFTGPFQNQEYLNSVVHIIPGSWMEPITGYCPLFSTQFLFQVRQYIFNMYSIHFLLLLICKHFYTSFSYATKLLQQGWRLR